MEGQETRYNNAIIRIHIPDHSKEERTERIKQATETFMKKVMLEQSRKVGNK